MIQIDRKSPPGHHEINNINLQKPVLSELSNKVPIYILNTGVQEVVRIDFIFSAGNWFESGPLVARTTNALLTEGTGNMSAYEIAEKLEYYGTFIQMNNFYDYSDLMVYSLKKHLKQIFPVICDIIKDPSFPEKELSIYLKNSKQNFEINRTKVQNLAREKFLQVVFGQVHPYGRMIEKDDYEHINKDEVYSHYKKYYTRDNCKILISGKVDNEVISMVDEYFGKSEWGISSKIEDKIFPVKPAQTRHQIINKDDAVQSALRIGKKMILISNQDYFGMSVLNKILGGYFGSRLMSNIREDKGYTYGIGSMLVSLKNEGYFVIASEVAAESCIKAVNEVYLEIEKLKNEKVGMDELSLVKNYILGQMLRSFDGPFNLANSYRTIIENGLEFDFYEKYISSINNITDSEIMTLANKYFDKDSFFEVIAGKY